MQESPARCGRLGRFGSTTGRRIKTGPLIKKVPSISQAVVQGNVNMCGGIPDGDSVTNLPLILAPKDA